MQVIDTAGENAVVEFFQRLKAFCENVPDEDNCPRCCMRMLCTSAPASINDQIVRKAFRFLEQEQVFPPVPERTDKANPTLNDHRTGSDHTPDPEPLPGKA